MLNIAFKEWALICRALAEGRQALILRKGGVAEVGGEFRPEHDRFWLYPTFVHELRAAVKPAVRTLFDRVLSERPDSGKVRLTHFAEVRTVYCVRRWELVASLDNLHVWTEETVRTKFNYRKPELFTLPVRVFAVRKPLEFSETEAYAGCKTWVQLDHELPTEGATPVLDDGRFESFLDELDRRLNPVMFA